ncbi:MAG: response regulator [Ignavibacteria bacterium]|nr:response regulator [Ignavibacteria bacterium]
MTRDKSKPKSQTVLFIDDESPWLDAIRMAVQEASFKVITADSGEAALKVLKRKKPDLIMSDVRMPFMNGFDLFEKVKSDPRLKSVPYVFMSSIDDLDAKRTAREIGADDYVEKPINSEDVKRIVLDLLMRFKRV